MTLGEIVRFKEWVISNNCEAVAIESTGVYWIAIYTVLEGSVEVILANAYKIKHTPGNHLLMNKEKYQDSEMSKLRKSN